MSQSLAANVFAPGAVLDELTQEVMDLVNACQATYGTHDGNKMYRPELISQSLKRADETVTGHFLKIAGHPRRSDFITATKVDHRALVPTHIGPIDVVRVGVDDAHAVMAENWSASEIEIIRENVGYTGSAPNGVGVLVVKPKWAIVDNRLFIVSNNLSDSGFVDLANFKAMTMGFMSPPEFNNAVIAWALRYIFGKDAADTEAGGQVNFGQIADTVMQYVENNEMVPPMAQEAIGR